MLNSQNIPGKKEEPYRKKEFPPRPPLYSVAEREGQFVAVLPTLISYERRATAGTAERTFATREEAEAAVEKAREDTRVRFELHDLQKTFTSTYHRIEPRVDGGYVVKIPATYQSEHGRLIGSATIDCATWDEAKAVYLKERKDSERLTHAPILDIRLSEKAKIAFSDFNAFNPTIAPGTEAVAIPIEVQKVLMTPEQMKGGESAMSYHKTLERKHWVEGIYGLVDVYTKGSGAQLRKELGIESLDHLSPKQAIELSTRCVLDLTKYYVREDLYRDPKTGRGIDRTAHDAKDAVEILEEGMKRKGDPTWEGNGVCRNFAGTVKAVFEALKARQGAFTRLENTYCLYEARQDSFEPTKEDWMDLTSASKVGHAWNTFVTLNAEGAAHAVIADVTWAKRDLETGKIDRLDQTLTRMEPFVIRALDVSAQSGMSAKEIGIEREKALSYYLFQIERLSSAETAFEKQQVPFFVSRCVEILGRAGEIKLQLSKSVLSTIEEVYGQMGDKVDRSEIEGLWRIYQIHRSFTFPTILKKYLTGGIGGSKRLMFKDDDLQAFAYDAALNTADMLVRVSTDPALRVRMREVQPAMFGTFDATSSKEDASELRHLLTRNPNIESLASRIRPGESDKVAIQAIMDQVRNQLRKLHPERYEARIAKMGDYDVVKNFTSLRKELSAKE